MHKTRASYLFVTVLSFLAVIVDLFFAATASKNAVVFIIVAIFLALNGVFWAFRFAKASRV